MKLISSLAGYTLGSYAAVAILGGCSTGASQPPFIPSNPGVYSENHRAQHHSAAASGYTYVSNLTRRGTSQLLVYSGTQNLAPIKTITKGLSDVQGVAVDPTGDVYVANGSGGNVLEFSPGGASLVQTYSEGLVHPAGVTVAHGTLYVTDQGDAQNGYTQQVYEYKLGHTRPLIGIAGIGDPGQLNEGIAVNPLGSRGEFYVAASTIAAVPPVRRCPPSSSYTVAEDIFPTLWLIVPLSNNRQASGLAFDSSGNLYVADVCNKDVAIYSDGGWTYSGKVPGTFQAPLYLNISNDFLAIPSSKGATAGSRGYVTIVNVGGDPSSVTITNGLEHPVGAAVGSGLSSAALSHFDGGQD
jgi:NHL repeat